MTFSKNNPGLLCASTYLVNDINGCEVKNFLLTLELTRVYRMPPKISYLSNARFSIPKNQQQNKTNNNIELSNNE